jgi:hypothetical protein
VVAHEPGHLVVGKLRQLARDRRVAQLLDRRRAQHQNLAVVVEGRQRPLARIEVVEHGILAQPRAVLADGGAHTRARQDLLDPLQVANGRDVCKGVDLHVRPRS